MATASFIYAHSLPQNEEAKKWQVSTVGHPCHPYKARVLTCGCTADELANTDSAFSPNNPPGRNVENVEKEVRLRSKSRRKLRSSS